MSQKIALIYRRVILGYRRQNIRAKATIWTVIAIILVLILPQLLKQDIFTRHATAQMYFLAPQQQPTTGQIFSLELRVNTTGSPINAVGTVVQFNPQYLEIVKMTTEKSFCSFYLENSFDNIRGEVKLSCGVPTPGFLGDSIVVRLDLRAKVSGSATVKTVPADTTILANDGKGTNIIEKAPEITLNIAQLF